MRPNAARYRIVLAMGLCWVAQAAGPVSAEDASPTGRELALAINARPRATSASRTVILELFDEHGGRRERTLRSHWKLDPDARRLVYVATAPPDWKDHAFLARDPFDASQPDEQWTWSPTLQTRRVPDLGRGHAFLGSEFSLEDLKKEDRVEVGEYEWARLGEASVDGRVYHVLEQRPVSEELARSLGFGRVVSLVDAERLVRRRLEYWDLSGSKLKRIEVQGREIDGYWTATAYSAVNHQTGRRSVFRVESVDYDEPIPDEFFEIRALGTQRLRR